MEQVSISFLFLLPSNSFSLMECSRQSARRPDPLTSHERDAGSKKLCRSLFPSSFASRFPSRATLSLRFVSALPSPSLSFPFHLVWFGFVLHRYPSLRGKHSCVALRSVIHFCCSSTIVNSRVLKGRYAVTLTKTLASTASASTSSSFPRLQTS